MKQRMTYLSMLPLPLLAGVFLASQPDEPEQGAPATRNATAVAYVSQFPPPQTDPKEVPVEPAPTF
ncbi:MAG: hypothetical protein SFV21_14295 [Rhodospirillaceae bacterium]|nr:hypothetical protein [Rhodospirillaceae bacterium]